MSWALTCSVATAADVRILRSGAGRYTKKRCVQSALVDSGPLIALFDRDDAYHDSVKAFLKASPLKLTTTWPVLTEVCALLPQLPAFDFVDFACRGGVAVEDLDAADLSAMLALSRKYADVPMDFADASLVVLAMKRGIDVIVSLDQDFDIYRLAYKKSFKNLLSSLRRR
jgi:predicted nucleic acid-binding protein